MNSNLKNLIAAIAITLALALTGCSKTQTTPILSETWDTGQHRTCLYGHGRLYCGIPEQITVFKPPVTPYFMESHRALVTDDKRTDSGTYETRFTSHTPMDFSTWDCYKTGKGSPAIVCGLIHKPTREETTDFIKTEKTQKDADEAERARKAELHRLAPAAVAYLQHLTSEDVIAACGPVVKKRPFTQMLSEKDVTEVTIYKMNKGLFYIKYPFAEFGFLNGTLSNVFTTYPVPSWYGPEIGSGDDATATVLGVPCLEGRANLK